MSTTPQTPPASRRSPASRRASAPDRRKGKPGARPGAKKPNFFTKKAGPFPVWVWIAGGAVVLVVAYEWFKNSSGAASNAGSTTAAGSAGGVGGGVSGGGGGGTGGTGPAGPTGPQGPPGGLPPNPKLVELNTSYEAWLLNHAGGTPAEFAAALAKAAAAKAAYAARAPQLSALNAAFQKFKLSHPGATAAEFSAAVKKAAAAAAARAKLPPGRGPKTGGKQPATVPTAGEKKPVHQTTPTRGAAGRPVPRGG